MREWSINGITEILVKKTCTSFTSFVTNPTWLALGLNQFSAVRSQLPIA
jgi:hypothetical protein